MTKKTEQAKADQLVQVRCECQVFRSHAGHLPRDAVSEPGFQRFD